MFVFTLNICMLQILNESTTIYHYHMLQMLSDSTKYEVLHWLVQNMRYNENRFFDHEICTFIQVFSANSTLFCLSNVAQCSHTNVRRLRCRSNLKKSRLRKFSPISMGIIWMLQMNVKNRKMIIFSKNTIYYNKYKHFRI